MWTRRTHSHLSDKSWTNKIFTPLASLSEEATKGFLLSIQVVQNGLRESHSFVKIQEAADDEGMHPSTFPYGFFQRLVEARLPLWSSSQIPLVANAISSFGFDASLWEMEVSLL
jgi:hypothetical protein